MTTCEINFRYHTVVIVPTKSTAFAREIKSGMNHGTSSLLLTHYFRQKFYTNSNCIGRCRNASGGIREATETCKNNYENYDELLLNEYF